MNKALFKRVRVYRTTVGIIKEMLSRGIITGDEYAIVCTVIASKNGLKSSTIFSEIDLISVEKRANIHF